MDDARPNLFTREDTLLGICEGLGDDFGFDPLWLRLALTAALFFQPLGAVAAYGAAGLVVLASRLLFPDPRPVPAAGEPALEAADAPEAANEGAADGLRIAA